MALKIPNEWLFPTGKTVTISEPAVQDFLTLIRRIDSPKGRKHILEEFKKSFNRLSGEKNYPSSNESWADKDLAEAAEKASENAPIFIKALVDAHELLAGADESMSLHSSINHILSKHNVPFGIKDGELVAIENFIAPPENSDDSESIVSIAFSHANNLIRSGQAPAAVDRVHTALHAYFRQICTDQVIHITDELAPTGIFKIIREKHPAFKVSGPRQADIDRLLKAFSTVVDSMSTIRNKASLAHVNELLDEPEATAAINASFTLFRYIQDRMKVWREQ